MPVGARRQWPRRAVFLAGAASLLAALLPLSCGERRDGERPASKREEVGVGGSRRAASSRLRAAPAEDVYVLVTNTQGHWDDVSIGAGNFRDDDEYVDASGQRRRGPTATLWIAVRDGPPVERGTRVYPGMTFEAGSNRFEVLAIEDDVIQLRVRARQVVAP